MFSEERFEQYAMQAEKMTAAQKWLNVDEVGKQLGIDSHESRLLADYLVDTGWAQVQGEPPSLRLTLEGRRAIAKLHWPHWRRWVDKNMQVVVSIASVVIAILALIVSVMTALNR